MNREVFNFQWEVNDDGYEQVEAVLADEPEALIPQLFLVKKKCHGENEIKITYYSPLRKYHSLFREFAEIEPNTKTISAFCSKYGLLGIGRAIKPIQQDNRISSIIYGEPMTIVAQEINTMRLAIRLWDLICSSKETKEVISEIRVGLENGTIGQTIQDPFIRRTHLGFTTPILMQEYPDQYFRSIPPIIFHNPSPQSVLQYIINFYLEKLVLIQMWPESENQTLQLFAVPKTLLGAMWIQFAQAVDGKKEYRSCERCGTWFEISPAAFRSHKRYCSDPCRMKNYRDRIEKTISLHKKGFSLEEISKQVGSNVKQVMTWIEKSHSL